MQKNIIKRGAVVIVLLAALRVLSLIPAFGINESLINSSATEGLGGMFDLLSGGAYASLSIMAIGISSYITASIIMQLLGVIFDKIGQLQHGGKSERDRYEKITTLIGVIFSIFSSVAMAAYLGRMGYLLENSFLYICIVAAQFLAGCIITIFCSNIITKQNLGSGISLILVSNILSSFISSFLSFSKLCVFWDGVLFSVLGYVVAIFAFAVFIFFVYTFQKRCKHIPVNYTKRLSSSVLSEDKRISISYGLPGVMPVILSTSLFQMLTIIISMFGSRNNFLYELSCYFTPAMWFSPVSFKYSFGVIPFLLLTIVSTLFYGSIIFNTESIAKGLQSQGGIIKGVRPGNETERFLTKAAKPVFLIGGVVSAIVVLVPMFIANYFGVNVFHVGTGVFVLTSVSAEVISRIKSEAVAIKPKTIF